MRIFAGICCVLMLLFAVVQYNDPDGLFWGVIYGTAAVWCGLASLRPAAVSGPIRKLFFGCMLLAAFGVAWFWPKTPGFWQQDVWWVTETAREGMGMMITLIALAVAWFAAKQQPLRD